MKRKGKGANRQDGRWLANTPIAHRGLHDPRSPENSLKAFRNAVRHGYAIETDVQLSKDGEPVVFHDYGLERMTGKACGVGDLTFDELKALRLAGSDSRIPSLKEALSLVDGATPLLIEVKNQGRPGKLERELCLALDDYRGDFAVQSFNTLSILAVGRMRPDFLCGQLLTGFNVGKKVPFKTAAVMELLGWGMLHPDFLACNIKDLPDERIAKMREEGQRILGWTIRSKGELDRANISCENVIFENILL